MLGTICAIGRRLFARRGLVKLGPGVLELRTVGLPYACGISISTSASCLVASIPILKRQSEAFVYMQLSLAPLYLHDCMALGACVL